MVSVLMIVILIVIAIAIMIIIIITFIVHRPQEMGEDPPGHLLTLPARGCVGEPKVDPEVDASINHFLGRLREAIKCPHVLNDLGVGTGDLEGEPVPAEIESKYPGYRAGDIVCARGIVRIGRSVDQRLPFRVADRPPVAVVVPLLDGCDGPPEDIAVLTVPGSD